MKTKQTLALLAYLFLLFGCRGGDSSSATPSPPPVATSPPVPTNAGGIWEGTATDTNSTTSRALNGMITETGEGRFVDMHYGHYVVSNVHGYDGNVTMDVMAISRTDFVFLDGSSVTTGTITGTIVERVSFVGNYSFATGESGTISLEYNSRYERDSSLAKLEGMWDHEGLWNQEGKGILIIEADGSFFEQTVFGCVYDGQISIIDPDYHPYAVAMTISLCGDSDGAYSGLGSLGDLTEPGAEDWFWMTINSNTLVFYSWFRRL